MLSKLPPPLDAKLYLPEASLSLQYTRQRREVINKIRSTIDQINEKGNDLEKDCAAHIDTVKQMAIAEAAKISVLIESLPKLEPSQPKNNANPFAVVDEIFDQFFAAAIAVLEKQPADTRLPPEMVHGDSTMPSLIANIIAMKDSFRKDAFQWANRSEPNLKFYKAQLNQILQILNTQIAFIIVSFRNGFPPPISSSLTFSFCFPGHQQCW